MASAITCLIVFIGLTLLIIDESDDFIEEHWKIIAILSDSLLTVLIYIILKSLHYWLGFVVGKEHANSSKNDKQLIDEMYRRSDRFNKGANITLIVLIIMIVGSSIVFFKASGFVKDDFNSFIELVIPEREFNKECNKDQECKKDRIEDARIPIAEDNLKQQASQTRLLLMIALVRIGDVAFASYLAYVALRIYRYKLRMAAFYMALGDALSISGKDHLTAMSPDKLIVLLDPNFDFGKDQPTW